MVEKIVVGKDWKDLKKFGERGTAYIGKHVVGKGEEAHLTNPMQMDLTRPHIVLVCGKRGTGKCMVGSTPIVLADGSILPIREVVESNESSREIPKKDEKLVKLEKPFEILSLTNDLKVKKKKVSHVYKRRIKEKVIKIRTRSGRELLVTKEHPLLTFSGELKWKESGKLRKGDYISLSRRISTYSKGKFRIPELGRPATQLKSRIKSDILKKLLDGEKQLSILAKELRTQKVWEHSHEMASQGLLSIHNNSPLTARLTDSGRDLANQLDSNYKRLSTFSTPIKIPKFFNNDLAEFLAYIIAEGCEVKGKNKCRFLFSNSDAEKIRRFETLSRNLFGMEPSKMDNGLYIDSIGVEKILTKIGYVPGKKSKDKDIPQAILKSDNDTIRTFLRAFFDCEAWVSKRDPKIEISSASKELSNKLSLLLLRFGIFSVINSRLKYAANTKKKTKRKYFFLSIYGSENLRKFTEEIGFNDKNKLERLEKYVTLHSNPNFDIIPNVGHVIKDVRTKIGLRACDVHKFKQVTKSYEDGKYMPTRNFLKNIRGVLKKRFSEIEISYKKLVHSKSIEQIQKIIEITPIQWKDVFKEMGVSYTGMDIFNSKKYRTLEKRKEIVNIISEKIKDILHENVSKKIELLDKLTNSDIFWDMIVETKEEFFDDWVYDMTVPETHNFIAGAGIICHNSYTAGVVAEEIYKLPGDILQNISVLMIDTMGIYWSMKLPNEKDVDILKGWGLKPQGLANAKIFVPKGHVREYKEAGITIDYSFTLSVGELTAEDWITTFGFSMIDEHGILIERVIDDLKESYGDKYSISDIIREIEKDKRTEQNVKDALVNRFLAAREWGLFEKEGTKIGDLLKPGIVSILDVSHYMRVSESWSIRAMLVALLSRKIFSQRLKARKAEEYGQVTGQVKKTMPMVWLMVDEMHQFIPNEGSTAATGPLLTLIKEGREPGISLLMITQRPNKLHEDALSQADLVISHRLTSKADIEALRSIMQTYMLEDIQDYLNDLPRTKGSAIILDDNSERIYQAQIRPRFSWHAGGSPIIIKEKSLIGEEKTAGKA